MPEPPPTLEAFLDLTSGTARLATRVDVDLATLIELPDAAKELEPWIPSIAVQLLGAQATPSAEAFGLFATAGRPGTTDAAAQLLVGTVAATAPSDDHSGEGVPFVIALHVASPIDLGAAPLFGSMMTGTTIQDIQASWASDDIPAKALVLPPPAPRHSPPYPKGFSLHVTLVSGGTQEHFVLTPAKSKRTAPATAGDGEGDPGTPPVLWFTLGKTFGPITIARLGIVSGAPGAGQAPRFGLALDASVKLASLGVDLKGFSLTFPQDDIAIRNVRASLDGLDVSFQSSSVQLQGGLVRVVESDYLRYDGTVTVRAGQYGIAGVGSFADFQGGPSLFVFGVVNGPFGGPPAFYVTGLAAGFGIRRDLRLPKTAEVPDFPLIAAAEGKWTGQKDKKPEGALAKLDEGGWVPPKAGSYWLAAGVRFRSFEMVDGVAVLAVQFGNELVVALLGVAKMRLPKTGKPYAQIALALDAVLRPSEGTVKVNALLGPESWVIDPACHLSGGFAFWMWFGGNEHSGDFVVSLGGYHPRFKPAEWYPAVPRLAFDWKVSSEVHIGGEAYFALTPSSVMAGGLLRASYTSGELRAWFVAQADLLMYWNPFQFEVAIGVSLGASYTMDVFGLRKTFSIDLSARVELWGPPIAGIVEVDWVVISFTVRINGGARPRAPVLANWGEFAKAFLPAAPPTNDAPEPLPADPVCRPLVESGLQGSVIEAKDEVWLVRPEALVLVTESVVPATRVFVNHDEVRVETQRPGVYPLGSVLLESRHTVRVLDGHGEAVDVSAWDWTPRLGRYPEALWGRENTGRPLLAAEMVDVTIGARGVAPKPAESAGLDVPEDRLVTTLDPRAWEVPGPRPWPARPPRPDPSEDGRDVIARTVDEGCVVKRRADTVRVISEALGRSLRSDDQSHLANDVNDVFQSAPRIRYLGARDPATSARRIGLGLGDHPARTSGPRPGARTATLLRAVARQRWRPRPGVGWWRGPHAWGSSHLLSAASHRRDRHAALAFLDPDGATFSPGDTLVWDLREATRGLRVEGDVSVRLVALDDQGVVLADRVLGTGEYDLPPATGRLAVTARDAAHDAELSGWVGPSGLLQVGPQAFLAEGAVVRPQAPLRLGPGRADIGLTTGRAVVRDNLTLHDSTVRPGWVATTFAAPCPVVAVLARRASVDLGETEIRSTPLWLGHDSLTPSSAATLADLTCMTYDTSDRDAGFRVLVDTPEGWELDGVVGLPRGLVAEQLADANIGLRPSAGASTGEVRLTWR